MQHRQLSRRAFLSVSGNIARGSCIALSMPMILTACDRATQSRLNSESFKSLSEDEALEFAAIAARIIPSDETPGATEAGVIYFIDTVLEAGRKEELTTLREGLGDLQARTVASYRVDYFHLLNEEQQDQLLREIEDSEFFRTIRFLTVAGMFSIPDYGGNREGVGYQLLGFENQHAWQPPFGFYDADYAEKGE